ncbi:MAG: ectoine/hydroxyectoine ABC transporter substrate-binding protein EhuB [Pseudonocardiaceae bacterium]
MPATQISRRNVLRYSAAGAAALGGSALLGACSTTEPGTGARTVADLSQRVQQGLPVRLAIANEPPYSQLQPNGEITGAAPDVAKTVLRRMGVDNVEGVTTDYDSMIPGLDAGRWDIVAAGLFMDRTRCSKVLYSAPDIVSTESFATAPGNPKNITTLDAVKTNPDIRIAALAGSYELKTATSLGIPKDQIQTYPRAPEGLQALNDGRVDALLLPTLSLQALKKQQGGDFVITKPLDSFPTTGSGAAFRKSDKEFHGRYNTEFKAFKETEEFASILDRWGFSAEAARQATTEQLCATEG